MRSVIWIQVEEVLLLLEHVVLQLLLAWVLEHSSNFQVFLAIYRNKLHLMVFQLSFHYLPCCVLVAGSGLLQLGVALLVFFLSNCPIPTHGEMVLVLEVLIQYCMCTHWIYFYFCDHVMSSLATFSTYLIAFFFLISLFMASFNI